MTEKLQEENPATEDELDSSYKNISKSAVFSIALGILSTSGFLFAAGVTFSLVGMGFASIALVAIRKYPNELTGVRVAIFGLAFCAVSFLAASGMHTYIYLTEVPPDHTRLTFGEIKSPKYRQYTPTERAIEMDGKKVFIKGYTFPGKQKKNLAQFLLVGDFGQCCFGGNPEPTHLVKVSIKNGRKIDYSQRLRKLSGTFRVLSGVNTDNEGKGYLYEIAVDEIK